MTAWCVVYELARGGIDENRYYARTAAMAEYAAVVADPPPGVVAVWITRQGQHEDSATVILGTDLPEHVDAQSFDA